MALITQINALEHVNIYLSLFCYKEIKKKQTYHSKENIPKDKWKISNHPIASHFRQSCVICYNNILTYSSPYSLSLSLQKKEIIVNGSL